MATVRHADPKFRTVRPDGRNQPPSGSQPEPSKVAAGGLIVEDDAPA